MWGEVAKKKREKGGGGEEEGEKKARFEGEPRVLFNTGRRSTNEIRFGASFLPNILISLTCPRRAHNPLQVFSLGMLVSVCFPRPRETDRQTETETERETERERDGDACFCLFPQT